MWQRAIGAIAVAALVAGACSDKSGDRANKEEPNEGVTLTKTPIPAADDSLAVGDVRIVTTNDGVDLALVGDTISSGLSPAALRKVRAETDTLQVSGTGLGASIEKMVKGTVQGAIGTRVSFPVSSLRGARYENDEIVFDWAGSPRKIFDQTKIDGKPLLASFKPEDARRFVDAVNARVKKPKNM